jgi:hypothetical protein
MNIIQKLQSIFVRSFVGVSLSLHLLEASPTFIVDAMSLLHQGRGALHPINEEHVDTPGPLPCWSDPMRTREEMVIANGLFKE